ncbi:tryptophan synthase subunit alpha [Candidatus Micrarchaeota archaeon]|nr:tryptophan synthase subunit alpha [Candidatus Micrarchaeota archaeon]
MKFTRLFESKKFVFLPYVCLGYPTLQESIQIVKTLEPFADGFELGIPFSDPVADGPVLQAATQAALKNGFHVTDAFRAIREIRSFTQKPLAVMTYLNPVLAYGLEKFASDAQNAGADAVIVPDSPMEENDSLQAACSGKLEVPLFVSPTTPDSRAAKISEKAQGFVYGIAVKGVTGARENAAKDMQALVGKVKNKPVAIGFGISKAEHVQAVKNSGARGFIVGSQIVKAYNESKLDGVKQFAKSLSP